MNEVPKILHNKLLNQYGESITNEILDGYSKKRVVTIRVNTLKSNIDKIKQVLTDNNILFEEVDWYKDALILKNVCEEEIKQLPIYNNGEIYLQSLSSMLPAIILNPSEEDHILDMTAAPGSKTTQIASLTNNKALITACEKNKIRFDRLKYNIQKQGATKVTTLMEDARNLDSLFSFDKILLDAPCSGSGTIYLEENKMFTIDFLNKLVKTQTQLLDKAIELLKVDCEMVYSTCSILTEENEEILLKHLNKDIEIIPIDKSLFKDISLLPTNIEGTICVCPNEYYEGFFVAKMRKIK